MRNNDTRTRTLQEAYGQVFNRRLLTAGFAAFKLIEVFPNPITWQDLYNGTPLKDFGVSEKTLASVLKSWVEAGVVKKVKAPFPYRYKYQLIEKEPGIDTLYELLNYNAKRSFVQRQHLEDFNAEPLEQVGLDAVEDWEFLSKLVFVSLLKNDPVCDKEDLLSSETITFLSFFMIHYLFDLVLTLRSLARKKAISTLWKDIEKLRKSDIRKEDLEKIDATKIMHTYKLDRGMS